MPLVVKKKKGQSPPPQTFFSKMFSPSIAHPSLFETSQTLPSRQDDARPHWPTKMTAQSYIKPRTAVELKAVIMTNSPLAVG